jgi:UDP-galactopyranose mutase
MKYDYIIVGAGLSGAVVANMLAENKNKSVLVIEKRKHIGGNCYDFKDDNEILIHKYGPHCFHTNSEKVWKYLSRFTDWEPYEHKVLAKIDEHFVPVPFNLTSIKKCFPDIADLLIDKLILRYSLESKIPILELQKDNDEDLKQLADFIYKKIFLGYTIKQWGMKPEELSHSVTDRIPIFISNDDRYFQDKYQAVPKDGYTKMVTNMMDKPNIKVLLNTDYFEIKDNIKYEKLFFSGMIDKFYHYRFGKLPYRSLKFEFETINKIPFQSVAQVNYPNENNYTRITEFIHFYKNKNYDKSIIAKEYSFQYENNSKEPPYYPIPQKSNIELYEKYKNISNSNIIFIGRLGNYSYYNMDQVVAQALLLCDNWHTKS